MSYRISNPTALVGPDSADVVGRCRAKFDRFEIVETLLARSIGAVWIDNGTPVQVNVYYNGYFPERNKAIERLVYYLRALVTAGPEPT